MSPADNADYYRRRVEEARSRADAASLPEVRRVHSEMADRYSDMLRDAERDHARPRLGIVPRI